jgi:hypothetical protein
MNVGYGDFDGKDPDKWDPPSPKEKERSNQSNFYLNLPREVRT